MASHTYKPDDEIIEGKYKIISKLGNGAFGDIFKGSFYSFLTNS